MWLHLSQSVKKSNRLNNATQQHMHSMDIVGGINDGVGVVPAGKEAAAIQIVPD
jgi:hypothetical protein